MNGVNINVKFVFSGISKLLKKIDSFNKLWFINGDIKCLKI